MKHLTTFLLLFVCITTAAQNSPTENNIPNISAGNSHINIGLIGQADTLKGLQLNLLNSAAGKMEGLQMSPVLSVAKEMEGLQIAGISTLSSNLNGIQISSFNNVSLSPFKGIQLAGISNVSMGVERGMQLAFTNVTSSYMRGAQIGGYNYADTLNGSQVGLINVALSHPKGWQVGIFNYTLDTIAHKIGLVNINPKTRMDVMVFFGNTSKTNMALRFRNRSTYNIIGAGTHYMGLDERFSGTLFYRIGQYFTLAPKWTVSGDIGFYHIETFEQHSNSKPERLYSFQAHINADYQISPVVGIYSSLGYGDTHYYSHHELYKHGFVGQLGLTFKYNTPTKDISRLSLQRPRRRETEAEERCVYDYKRPWLAAAEATGINLLVHCFDRFIMNEDFAQVNLHTIHKNFKKGFVWDNDQFSTNLFAHPYHGNLYFNAARSCGLNFWESAPYAMAGSLMWEFAGEIEPPAINDLMATTFGGICIGEITHRISDLILNDRNRGFRRFLREAGATLISPMKGFNRMISGRAFTTDPEAEPYPRPANLNFSITAGDRYVADDGAMFRGEHQPCITFDLEYGDPLNEDNKRPYDFFTLNATFGFTGNQPLINNLHILGQIWSATAIRDKKMDSEFGIYQHFNYYDSKPVKDGSDQTPFRISEAASVGPGFIFRYNSIGSLSFLEQRTFISGILLGGTKSDYYNIIDRDYNMGSGYSVKMQTLLSFRKTCTVRLIAEHYRIFTWKGYEGKDLETINPLYLNAQGDKGNAKLTVLISQFDFPLSDRLKAEMASCYFMRDTHYKYYEDVRANTFELRLGMAFCF